MLKDDDDEKHANVFEIRRWNSGYIVYDPLSIYIV